MNDPDFTDPSQIRPGPIRNRSLSPELLAQIKQVFDVIGPYLDTTLEQFEIGFMRDSDPNTEVALWILITASWLDYHNKFVGENRTLPEEEERSLIEALIAISTGVADPSQLGVPVEVGRRLLQIYDDLLKDED